MESTDIERGHVLERVTTLALELSGNSSEIRIPSDASLEAEIGLDSLKLLELIELVEHEFGISVPDSELRAEHLASVGTVADLVGRVVGAQSGCEHAVDVSQGPDAGNAPACG